MEVDLNAIAVFARVASLGSFAGAARALGMPRSTVSARVAQLEEALGTRLLARTTRRVRLTDAGRRYLGDVGPALDALAQAAQVLDAGRAMPTGLLRITAPVDFGLGSPILGDVLSDYVRECPQVEVHLELLDRRVDLVGEGFDLALRVGTLPDAELVARRLGSSGGLRLWASPAYLETRGIPQHPTELLQHDCLVMSAHGRWRTTKPTWRFQVGDDPLALTVAVRAAANSYQILRRLAAAGAGVTRLPALSSPRAVEDGLVPILDEFALPPVHWHALYPDARHLPLRVRRFVDLLVDRFSRAPSTTH